MPTWIDPFVIPSRAEALSSLIITRVPTFRVLRVVSEPEISPFLTKFWIIWSFSSVSPSKNTFISVS